MEDPLQIIIVVIIMAVGAVRWFIENVVQKGKNHEEESEGGTLEDLYEEARREIQDRQARMYPEDEETQGPPIIQRRQQQPAPEQRPQQPTTPPPLPSGAPTPATSFYPTFQASQVTKPALSAAEQAALARVQEGEALLVSKRKKRKTGATTGVRVMLATPEATKKAVLLREILGPPKGEESSQW